MSAFVRLIGLDPLDEGATDPAALDNAVRERMFRFGAFSLTLVVLIYVAVHTNEARWRALGADLILLAAIFLCVVYARVTRNYFIALNLMHASLFGIVCYQGYLQGVANTAAFWWLSILPFISIVSGARLLAFVQLVAFSMLALAVGVTGQGSPPEPVNDPTLHPALSSILCTTYCFIYMMQGLRWRDQLRRALVREHAAAVAAGSLKSRFLATMSHEIRTPLNGVVGAAELLQRNSLSEGEREQMVSLLTQSSRALLALINDILDWSKLDVGKITIDRHPVNLRSLVFESNELFAAQAANKNIELTSSCDPDVPRMLLTDPTRIRQIMNNLVSNAVKFTSKGGVHIHLSIDGVDPQDRPSDVNTPMVRIEVSDSGIGMPPEKLGRLFQAFSQADASVTRHYGGTGLGLAISQELANLMGGHISVSSRLGEGSVFTVQLPMKVIDTTQSFAVPRARSDILLATAHEGVRRHLRSILHDLRISPATASSLPADAELDGCRLLLVDAPLLIGIPDLSSWLDLHAACHRRVAVLTPLNCDAVIGVLPEAVLLYKPARLSSVRSLIELVDGPSPTLGQEQPDGSVSSSPPPLRGLRVLIAEDNQVNQIVFQAMLAQAEADCSIARNGQEALDALALEAFDVVLMDVQMPVLDGISAVRQLRAREASTPGAGHTTVVAMTANTEQQDIAECRGAGMDDFLPKPFSIGQLTAVLARHARRSPEGANSAPAVR